MPENTEKTEKKEYVEVPYSPFEAFDGSRIDRDFYLKDRLEKITFRLPIPRNDDEAKTMYGCELSVLVEKGVKQASYDKDSGIHKALKDNPSISLDDLASMFERDLPALPTKRERRSEDKTLANAIKAAAKAKGVSTKEILAQLRAM